MTRGQARNRSRPGARQAADTNGATRVAVVRQHETPDGNTRADECSHDPRAAIPERPTVVTHAHTVAPGVVEIETGLQGFPGGGGATWMDTPSLGRMSVSTVPCRERNVPDANPSGGPDPPPDAQTQTSPRWRPVCSPP